MPKEKISLRELLVVLCVGLLSPAIRVLPAIPAAAAGEAGWLSSLAALPAALVLFYLLFRLIRGAGEGAGLQGALRRSLGRGLGAVMGGIYLLWGLFLLCLNTRQCAQRFLSTGYRNAPEVLYIVVLLALALWMARGKLAAFTRAGEVFYLILAVTLALVLGAAAFQVEVENVFPVWYQDVPGILWGSVSVLSTLAYGVYGAFLAGAVERGERDGRRGLGWTAALCLVLTALQFIDLGNFGPGLVKRMEQPFFMMVKGIGIQGAFQRVESVVIALWALSDLIFLGLLLLACCTLAGELFGFQDRKKAAFSLGALALVGSLMPPISEFVLSALLSGAVTWGNLILGFGVPAAVFLLAKLRKQI